MIDKTDGCNWNDRVHGKATVWWRPFIFWRTREGFLLPLEQYPFIRLCCGRFNTSLPSSIPAERLFSFTEIIFYLRRSWLTPENIWKFQGNQTGCWLKWSVVRQTIVCIFFLFVFFGQFCSGPLRSALFFLPAGFKVSKSFCVCRTHIVKFRLPIVIFSRT